MKRIILTQPEVRAVLDRRLTRLTVPLKPQPEPGELAQAYPTAEVDWQAYKGVQVKGSYKFRYRIGSELWVAEAWAKVPRTAYWHDSTIPHREMHDADGYVDWAVYKAGWERCAPMWRSPATMPRAASRLSCVVGDARVCRVDEVTSVMAIAMGHGPYGNSQTIDCDTRNPRDEFRKAWDARHGSKPGMAWGDRPWVETATVEWRT